MFSLTNIIIQNITQDAFKSFEILVHSMAEMFYINDTIKVTQQTVRKKVLWTMWTDSIRRVHSVFRVHARVLEVAEIHLRPP